MKRRWMMVAMLLAAAVAADAAPGDAKAKKDAAIAAAAQKAANSPVPKDGYTVADTINVAGEGLWENITVDADGKFLYVPKQRKTMVIEIATGKSVAEVIGGQGANSVALAPDVARGFVSNKDGTVTIFDTKTNRVLGSVTVGDDPGPLIYDPSSKKILVCCQGKIAVLAPDVNPSTGKPDASIVIQGKPDGVVVDGSGMAYMSMRDHAEIQVLDTRVMKIMTTWALEAQRGKPNGLSIDKVHSRLFMACANRLVVMSATDGHLLADLPVGQQTSGTAYSDGRVFVAGSFDGIVTVFAQNGDGKFEVSQTLLVKGALHPPAVNPKSGVIYVPTVDYDRGRLMPGTFKIQVLEKEKK